MMINEAILIGNVGRKETKSLKNGGEVTVVSLATTSKYQDYSGTKQSKTTWHNVNFFSKLSDIAKKYIHVGDLIYVRGEINNKKIENGERAGQYMYSVTAIEVKFFPSRQKKENMNSSSSEEEFDVTEEEIPF